MGMLERMEEYLEFKKEIVKKRRKAYVMANEDLAAEWFRKIQLDWPEASIFNVGNSQFICLTPAAREDFRKMMMKRIAKISEELKEITNNLEMADREDKR